MLRQSAELEFGEGKMGTDDQDKKAYDDTLARLQASPVWSKRDPKELEEMARAAALAVTSFPKSDPSIPPAPPEESPLPADASENPAPPGTFRVTIDYGQSRDQRVEAGKYDWVDSWTCDVPACGEGKHDCELVLVRLDEDASTEEVLTEFKRRGLLPARMEHLLAFGAKYPEHQRRFNILEFGSSWYPWDRHRRFVASLTGRSGKRELRTVFDEPGSRWNVATCVFLAVLRDVE